MVYGLESEPVIGSELEVNFGLRKAQPAQIRNAHLSCENPSVFNSTSILFSRGLKMINYNNLVFRQIDHKICYFAGIKSKDFPIKINAIFH